KYGIREETSPEYWDGFPNMPFEIEFWKDRPFRHHYRISYRRDEAEAEWRKHRLFP
ncbi:MAG: pdxH, partial [Hyphomicrobiales bacterium]|nr:pdxH [Hyphomicrobiales bacterium]